MRAHELYESAISFQKGDLVTYDLDPKKRNSPRGNAVFKTMSTKKNHAYIDTETEGTILVPVGELAHRTSNSIEEAIMETGNANAQQKGINFDGTPSKKNSGDIDLSSPKSKASGSKTPLAQAKGGTNVGKIKS